MPGKNHPTTHKTADAPMKPWRHPAAQSDTDLLAQCTMTKDRASGPGGQHRNKVETQVILHHRPTDIVAQASERRSVVDNKRVALRRLRLKLAVEVRSDVPAGEICSALWKSRRRAPKGGAPRPAPRDPVFEELGVELHEPPACQPNPSASGGRIECNPDHHDYPALLSEALDVIADANWDLKRAALRLEVSPTQLTKFIREHAPALTLLNKERTERGERPLK